MIQAVSAGLGVIEDVVADCAFAVLVGCAVVGIDEVRTINQIGFRHYNISQIQKVNINSWDPHKYSLKLSLHNLFSLR